MYLISMQSNANFAVGDHDSEAYNDLVAACEEASLLAKESHRNWFVFKVTSELAFSYKPVSTVVETVHGRSD